METTPRRCSVWGMLRFLEEALTNVIKHARAQQVAVTCTQPDVHTWVLSVQDDGVGFDWGAVQQARLSVGMRSMQTRVERGRYFAGSVAARQHAVDSTAQDFDGRCRS